MEYLSDPKLEVVGFVCVGCFLFAYPSAGARLVLLAVVVLDFVPLTLPSLLRTQR